MYETFGRQKEEYPSTTRKKTTRAVPADLDKRQRTAWRSVLAGVHEELDAEEVYDKYASYDEDADEEPEKETDKNPNGLEP